MWRALLYTCAVVVCLLAGGLPEAVAIEELQVEEDISELLSSEEAADGGLSPETRQWGILPQLGYAPDTGPVVGVKFTHRNVVNTGATFDLDGVYGAINQYQSLGLGLSQPHLADDHFIVGLRLKYEANPQRLFYGLGNNDQGPDPASTNSYQNAYGVVILGWRPLRSLAFNLTVDLRKVNIGRGDPLNPCGSSPSDCPFTVIASPDLPGVHGGMTNRIAASLVWNNRDSVVRPTHGWRAILKVIHTNKALLSDFEFTRYIADVGYLRAFEDGRYILGIRTDGEWVASPVDQAPYWELAELGGDDTMRGFFPHRFVGKGRFLLNGEFRFLLAQFNFFNLWQVKIDGLIFGDGGRVFLDRTDAKDEFKLNKEIFERITDDFQYSYGGGLRIALGEALVARIDAGFSNEETGLIYLSFGQTF